MLIPHKRKMNIIVCAHRKKNPSFKCNQVSIVWRLPVSIAKKLTATPSQQSTHDLPRKTNQLQQQVVSCALGGCTSTKRSNFLAKKNFKTPSSLSSKQFSMLKQPHCCGLEQKKLVAKVKIHKQHMKQKHQPCQVAQSLVGWGIGYIFSWWRNLDFLLLSTWFFYCDWFFCLDNQGLFFNFLCTCSSFYSRHPPNLLSRWLAVSCSSGLGMGAGRRNVRSRVELKNKPETNRCETIQETGPNYGGNRSEKMRKRSEKCPKYMGKSSVSCMGTKRVLLSFLQENVGWKVAKWAGNESGTWLHHNGLWLRKDFRRLLFFGRR